MWLLLQNTSPWVGLSQASSLYTTRFRLHQFQIPSDLRQVPYFLPQNSIFCGLSWLKYCAQTVDFFLTSTVFSETVEHSSCQVRQGQDEQVCFMVALCRNLTEYTVQFNSGGSFAREAHRAKSKSSPDFDNQLLSRWILTAADCRTRVRGPQLSGRRQSTLCPGMTWSWTRKAEIELNNSLSWFETKVRDPFQSISWTWCWRRMDISWTDRVKIIVLKTTKKEGTKNKIRLTGLVTSCVGNSSKTCYWRKDSKDDNTSKKTLAATGWP